MMEVISCESTNDGIGKSVNVNEELSSPNKDTHIDFNNNLESWSIRDQLMLISFAIVNGDSNWSYVSDQMNKAGLKKKTSAQCSKKYRQIIKDFLNKSEQSENKNQLIDLKKIYSEIAEQRLNEVNCEIKSLKDKYAITASKLNDLIDFDFNESIELPLSDKFKNSIIQWICLNVNVNIDNLNEPYNQSLIDKLRLIETNKELNDDLVDLLEKDADFRRKEDERLRLAELERDAELERLRLEAEKIKEEEEEKKRKKLEQEEEKENERKKKKEEEERIRKEQEELKKIEIKIESQMDEADEENSKDSSSRFSSEDDMPLLNIVKSKGLLIDNNKTKSPSPLPSEKVRRSLRKAKGDDVSSPNQMSSASSTISTISHKSVSLPYSSLSEDKETKHEVKASPSNTSSVYDNLNVDENQDIFKSKKKTLTKKTDEEPAMIEPVDRSSGVGLVSIKLEPKEGCSGADLENNKAANISGSSLSSVSSSKTSEEEKSHRAWKKSIMMILNNIACHKHATIFMHPVKDEIAPGYSTLIHRPIDLSTIKKNIETGSTRTTKEFQRDIMLMFTNALMYNSTNHNIHKIALEMFKEVLADIEQLLNAQEALCANESMDGGNYVINKPLRYKEMRSSSTASDGKSSSILSSVQHDESVAGLLVKKGRSIKETKSDSKSSLKDESGNDAVSIKSNSSVSTPRHSSTRSRLSSATKSNINQQKSPKSVKKEANSNGKKRKPSVSNSSANLNSSVEQAKDKYDEAPKTKRRKSGR